MDVSEDTANEMENDRLSDDEMKNLASKVFQVPSGSEASHSDLVSAVKLAWSAKQFDVLLALLEGDALFPDGFDYGELVEAGAPALRLKEFVDKRNELHQLVRDGKNLEKIRECVFNLTSKLAVGNDNKSLLSRSLETNDLTFEAFALLKSFNFRFKDLDEESKYQILRWEKKNLWEKAMHKYFPKLKNSHVLYLVSISKFSTHVENQLEKLTDFYNRLDAVEELSQILQVIECSDLLTIVFDLNNECVKEICLVDSSSIVMGLCETLSGHVYVGAKTLNEDFFGTLIHELSHYAFQATYENNANPFYPNETQTKKEFQDIIDGLTRKYWVDDIISRVWRLYNKNLWPAEMIVRVPEMIAKYGPEQGRTLLREQAPELLDFYERNVTMTYKKFVDERPFIVEKKNIQSSNSTSGVLKSISESEIRLEKTIDLSEFFDQKQVEKFFVLNTENTFISLVNVFQSLGKKMAVPFSNQCLFWSWNKYIKENKTKIIHTFYLAWCKLFVMEIRAEDDVEVMPTFLEYLNSVIDQFGEKRVILVVHKSKREIVNSKISEAQLDNLCLFVTDEEYNLSHLSEASQSMVLNQTVYLQSCNHLISLGEIVNRESYKIIDAETIVKLTGGETLNIGGQYPGSKDFNDGSYIERSFLFNCEISEEILNTAIQVAISGCSLKDLRNMENSFVKFKTGTKDRLVCLDDNKAEEQFQSLCQQNPSSIHHWLKCEKGKFLWQRSDGLTYELEPFVVSKGKKFCYSEEEVLEESCREKLVVISGKPGSGKSTFCTKLMRLMKNSDPSMIVVRLDLNNHTDELYKELKKKAKGKPVSIDEGNIGEFILTLLNSVKLFQTDFEKSVFRNLFDVGNVAILLDGFDEVCHSYEEIVLDMIEILCGKVKRLFVTTRPSVSGLLQDKLKVFSYKIRPLSETEQVQYLSGLFEESLSAPQEVISKERTEDFARSIIKEVTSTMRDRDMKYTSTPLMLKLLGKRFKDECTEFCNTGETKSSYTEKMTLITLISGFVRKMFNDHAKVKRDMDRSKNVKQLNQQFDQFNEELELLATFSFFSEDERKWILNSEKVKKAKDLLEKTSKEDNVGIVTEVVNNQPKFLHRVVQEYYVGQFISKRIRNGRQSPDEIKFLLTDVFLRDEYQVVRKFIEFDLPREETLKTYGLLLNEIWSLKRQHQTDKISNNDRATMLHVGLQENNIPLLKFILVCLEKCPNLEIVNATSNSKAALYIAAVNDSKDIVQMLVNLGADVNITDSYGNSPLHVSVSNQNLDITRLLVTHNAEVNSINDEGNTPFHSAFYIKNKALMQMLIDNGADVNLPFKGGDRPLYTAVDEANEEIAKMLVEHGAKLDLKDSKGISPLQLAVTRGLKSVVEIMVQRGGNIFERNDHDTLLHRAVSGGDLDVIRLILNTLVEQCGSDQDRLHRTINAADEEGDTPLMWAVEKNKVGAGKILMEYGADVDVKNKAGRTSVDWARESNNVEFLKLLTE